VQATHQGCIQLTVTNQSLAAEAKELGVNCYSVRERGALVGNLMQWFVSSIVKGRTVEECVLTVRRHFVTVHGRVAQAGWCEKIELERSEDECWVEQTERKKSYAGKRGSG